MEALYRCGAKRNAEATKCKIASLFDPSASGNRMLKDQPVLSITSGAIQTLESAGNADISLQTASYGGYQALDSDH